jgi:predicted nucleic acid-binding protein
MSPRGILVDSSAWIGFLRQDPMPATVYLESAVSNGAPLMITGVIVAELLRGCATDADAARLGETLRAWPTVEPQFPTTYEHAARLYRGARRQGLTIRSTIDCLLAALALENDLAVLHQDRDFTVLAQVSDLVCLTESK